MAERPRISIRITDDGMAAIASIQPGDPAGAAELDAALAGAGVNFGLDAAACRLLGEALEDPQFCDPHVELAFGRQAQEGRHGFFEPAFHVGIQAGTLRDDGSMDFHDRELLKPVSEGALVGHLYAAVSGVQGQRVDGGLVHVDAVREARLRLGPGVETDAEGGVHAKQAGIVAYSPEKSLDVVDHLVHRGDVDLHSGHLVMEGTLAVQGDVQRLFSVRVTGDVEIRGSVQGGSVYAGGDVHIKNGVFGGDTGMVCAEGSLWARHAESAQITCGGLLQLESAVNCRLSAEEIKVTRVLRGGRAEAERSLVAQEVGSPHDGLGTVISAAVPLERPVIEARRALGAAKAMPLADRHRGAAGRSDGEHGKSGKLERANTGLQRSEFEKKVQRAARRERLMDSARVHVTGVCYAGVVVEIGEVRLMLDQDQRGVRFSFDRDTRALRMEGASK
jgi:uncharacterized protein (DUF342 family)